MIGAGAQLSAYLLMAGGLVWVLVGSSGYFNTGAAARNLKLGHGGEDEFVRAFTPYPNPDKRPRFVDPGAFALEAPRRVQRGLFCAQRKTRSGL